MTATRKSWRFASAAAARRRNNSSLVNQPCRNTGAWRIVTTRSACPLLFFIRAHVSRSEAKSGTPLALYPIMSATGIAFHEANPWSTPIRRLDLAIAGSWLEPVIREFEAELEHAGIVGVRPRFYLSTEWGVPFNTIAVAIPFYLARADLIALHKERAGH